MHRVPPIPKGLKQAAKETAWIELFFSNLQNGECCANLGMRLKRGGYAINWNDSTDKSGELTLAARVR